MTDNVIKSLKWLIFNFPEIENPKDDADKISNCIHLYCQNAVDELSRQKAKIERLKARNNELNALNKTASIEAVRRFAERLKNLTASYWLDNINVGHIDKLVEEMVGD
jgi:FtsZ-binding cell division protein ZapB